jgi:hypothetical protein
MMPGRSVIARRLRDGRSAASARVSISRPAFPIEYSDSPAIALCAAPDDTLTIRRSAASLVKLRQKRLARTMGAVRLTQTERAMASASVAPITPTGSSVAALLTRHTARGACDAMSSNAGVTIAGSRVTSARSHSTNRNASLASRGDDRRPMPSTRAPRASSSRASASPSP